MYFVNIYKLIALTVLDSRFALKYPTLTTDVILSTDEDRVFDSAYNFSLGYGKPVEILTFNDIHLLVNWVLPWEECPNFDPNSGMKVSRSVVHVSDLTLSTQIDRLRVGEQVRPSYHRAFEQPPAWRWSVQR